ncbi:hypothetical protein LTR27_010092 [Elasticomyces elasticus]|nr:hypothetical protein LTR27_010092 [Elasticomyces elasticus]
MADQGKASISASDRGIHPSQLLDLPPELRVRIYECLYEDEAVGDVDYLTLRKHAPSVAITLVNRLIRHEVMPLYEGATKRFYQQQTFYIKMRMPDGQSMPDGQRDDTQLPEDMQGILTVVAAMPKLPLSSIRFKLRLEYRGGEHEDLRVDVRVTRDGGVKATHLWESDPGESGVPLSGEWLINRAKRNQIVMVQQNDPRFLDIGNVLRAAVM